MDKNIIRVLTIDSTLLLKIGVLSFLCLLFWLILDYSLLIFILYIVGLFLSFLSSFFYFHKSRKGEITIVLGLLTRNQLVLRNRKIKSVTEIQENDLTSTLIIEIEKEEKLYFWYPTSHKLTGISANKKDEFLEIIGFDVYEKLKKMLQ